MIQKEKFIALLIVLFARTAFIFGDVFFSSMQVKHASADLQTDIVASNDLKIKNNKQTKEISQYIKVDKTVVGDIEKGIKRTKTKMTSIKDDITKEAKLSIKKISTYNIEMLEKIYKQEKDPHVLKLLLQDLVSDYQFDKAKQYIANINIFQDDAIDAETYIYTYINSLSITDDKSMQKFMGFVDQIRYKAIIDSDDYIFYQGLSKLWQKDYKGANILFTQIKSSKYKEFIDQINKALNTFDHQKGVPEYYKNSLIALVAMKNGYFSLANKLAISSVLADNEYILPHQILAYSNFLTNNREKSIENFYDLVDLDTENQYKYNFYIGVAYYRWGDNQKSISVLSQLLDKPQYKTDAYRYLLLNYQKLKDSKKMIQVRQKLLGQNDLIDSDFRVFYDTVFYKPFSTDSQYTIYHKYKQLSYDFVSVCYENLGQENDTCLYGEAGLDVVNQNRQNAKSSLIYLSKNYPQSYVFQALGDYYKSQNLDQKAKTYYLKAVSLIDDISQKDIIEKRLISEIK